MADPCYTWTMDEPLAADPDERFRGGCSTHDFVVSSGRRSDVNAAIASHVADAAS